MRSRVSRMAKPLLSATAAVLLCGLALPAAAQPEGRCGTGQTLIRVDEKVCPPRPHQPAVTVERACCENRGGQTLCHPFPRCPSNSPS